MKMIFNLAAVVVAAVVGTIYCNNESMNDMSDVAKANVKALAGINVRQQTCFNKFEEAPDDNSLAVWLIRCSDCEGHWTVSVSDREECGSYE